MGKRTTKKKPSSDSAADLQRQVERLDRELVKSLNERAKLFQKLAKSRQQSDEPVFDIDRDCQLIEELAGTSKGPLCEESVRAILRELNSGSRALAKRQQVAYLGPKYSYSYLAAIERFGSTADLVPVSTISSVFEEVNRHQIDFGIVPIENSTDGRIVDTLDMFARLPVRICGEVQLRIHHYLLARCDRSEVREVYSKPQALSQCRDWLAKHLVGAKTVEMASTTEAAKFAAKKPGAAAVASREAGVQYGLEAIASKIEDNKNNITRFAVIGNELPKRTGSDKTSIMFEIAHQPGSLADAMAIFKRNKLNMTWIESFPMPDTKSEYLFFVELEGYQKDMKVRRALTALEKKTVRLDILGSYAKSDPV